MALNFRESFHEAMKEQKQMPTVYPVSEEQAVYLHKRDSLRDQGFEWDYAVALAKSDVDWHRAVRLLRRGCAQHLIVEILT